MGSEFPRIRARVRRIVFGGTALVSTAGLVAEVGEYRLGWPERAVELLSLSYEKNVPTWYATVLLFACSLGLARIAQRLPRSAPYRGRWWFLAGAFAYMSLDEAVEIHEHLVSVVWFDTGGILYFAWVLPASVIVAAIGLAYIPFLRALPRVARWRFVVAGGLYVGGALLMELPLGWWTEHAGDDNLTYGLIDWVEETLELVGASLFLVALDSHAVDMDRLRARDEAE